MAILKKKYIDNNVVEEAIKRIQYLYDSYDKVIVNFSGGKDSTALLYVAIEAARLRGKLPVEAVYIDHEIEGEGTINLLNAVNNMEAVDLKWYAMPFSLRNAASSYSPKWYPWHPDEKEIWVRSLPESAITEMDNYVWETDPDYTHIDGEKYKAMNVKRCMNFGDMVDNHRKNYERQGKTCISLVGIRAQESPARYTIMTRKPTECYISSQDAMAYPIYDWLATDVWKFIRETKLPYNTEYDEMNKTEQHGKLNSQRVGSVFAEESLRTLHNWRELYGDYWHKMLYRAEGVKTAWRYNNSGLYTGTKIQKEENVSYKEYTLKMLESMSPKARVLTKKSIKKIITWHKNQTNFPITDTFKDSCPLTGISWEFLAKIATRGDTKERGLQSVPQLSQKARKREGITRDEAVKRYGKPEYIKKYHEKKNTK